MNWIQGLYISILVLEKDGQKVIAEVWSEPCRWGREWQWSVSIDGKDHAEGVCDGYKPAEARAEAAVKKLMEATT